MRLGIDIGGTTIKCALADDNFNLVKKFAIPTNKNGKILIEDVKQIIKENLVNDLTHVGISTAGAVNDKGTIVGANNNIENYFGTNWYEIIESVAPGVTKTVLNDANALANYELKFNKADDAVFIVVGTGVGGALLIDGKLRLGATFICGEFGSTLFAGTNFDKILSAVGLFEKVNKFEKITSLEQVYESTNENVIALVKDYEKNFATLLSIVIPFINPEKIIIGGGIKYMGEKLLQNVEVLLKTYIAENLSIHNTKIYYSSVGNDGNILGVLV